jgi:hypothetical protein
LNGQSPEIFQQAELPEIKAIVTEHHLLKYDCARCGKNSVAPLPSGVPDSAFGPKLMGLMVTLTGVFHLIRDFHGYAERDGPDKQIGKALESELKRACHIHKRY